MKYWLNTELLNPISKLCHTISERAKLFSWLILYAVIEVYCELATKWFYHSVLRWYKLLNNFYLAATWNAIANLAILIKLSTVFNLLHKLIENLRFKKKKKILQILNLISCMHCMCTWCIIINFKLRDCFKLNFSDKRDKI